LYGPKDGALHGPLSNPDAAAHKDSCIQLSTNFLPTPAQLEKVTFDSTGKVNQEALGQ
jgi:hypothetical protein